MGDPQLAYLIGIISSCSMEFFFNVRNVGQRTYNGLRSYKRTSELQTEYGLRTFTRTYNGLRTYKRTSDLQRTYNIDLQRTSDLQTDLQRT